MPDIKWQDFLVPAQQTLTARLQRLLTCRSQHAWKVRKTRVAFSSAKGEELHRETCWACYLPDEAAQLWPHYTRDALVWTQHRELTDYLKAKASRHEAMLEGFHQDNLKIRDAAKPRFTPGRSGGYPAPEVSTEQLKAIKVPDGPAPGAAIKDSEATLIIPRARPGDGPTQVMTLPSDKQPAGKHSVDGPTEVMSAIPGIPQDVLDRIVDGPPTTIGRTSYED